MRKLRNMFYLAFLLMLGVNANAQEVTVWEAELESDPVWTHLTSNGVLLVGTSKWRVIGLDAKSGKVLWTSEFFKGMGGIGGGKAKDASGNKVDFAMRGSTVAGSYFIDPIETADDFELNDYAIMFTSGGGLRFGIGKGNWNVINMLTGEEINDNKLGLKSQLVKGFEYAQTVKMRYVGELKAVLGAGMDEKTGFKEKDAKVKSVLMEVKGAKKVWEVDRFYNPDAIQYMDKDGNFLTWSGTNLVMVNVKDGSVMWEVPEADGEVTVVDGGFVVRRAAERFYVPKGSTAKDLERYGYVPYDVMKVMKIDMNGKKVWEKSYEKGALSNLSIDPNGKRVYFFHSHKDNFFIGLDVATGKEVFNVQNKRKDMPFLQTTSEGFLVSNDKEVYLLNYADASEIWGIKDKLSPGATVTQDVFIVSNDKRTEMVGLDKKTGKEVWKNKSLDGGSVEYVFKGGVMVSSFGKEARTHFIDPKTGESKWGKKGIEYSSKLVFDDEGNMIRYSDGDLLKIDVTTGDINTFAAGIEFKKESLKTFQLRKNGYFLASDNGMALLDKSGKPIYSKYLAPPGESAFKVGLSVVGGLAAVAAGAAGAAQAQYNYNMGYSSYDAANSQYQSGNQLAAAGGALIGETIRKRFRATLTTDNYNFILTKDEEALNGEKGFGIVKVDKNNGEVQGAIMTKDRTPMYSYDTESGNLFLRTSNKVLTCYKF